MRGVWLLFLRRCDPAFWMVVVFGPTKNGASPRTRHWALDVVGFWRALTLPSAPLPAQLPLRGSEGHWISRLSACGWRSPRRSASFKTGPSTPKARRVWEQVTLQTGPRSCRNPALRRGDSQRRAAVCRFPLSQGGDGRGGGGGGGGGGPF